MPTIIDHILGSLVPGGPPAKPISFKSCIEGSHVTRSLVNLRSEIISAYNSYQYRI